MSKNIFKIMVELQHKFNKQVADDYLDKNFNWNSAIIAESGELLDSLGYKWWKKQVPDMENVKVEAIDLLHFVINEQIQRAFDVGEDGAFGLECVAHSFERYFDDKSNHFVARLTNNLSGMIDLLNFNEFNRFSILKNIFTQLEMTNEDVYIAYITKNCLNKFRQNNGYKDGTYIKDWNGKEDNVIAYKIANERGADEELFHHLYLDLTTYYYEEVLQNKKIILDVIDYKKALDTEV
jgi:dimeric dUTPase (all-alpha-NTP-PPase superfamily)